MDALSPILSALLFTQRSLVYFQMWRIIDCPPTTGATYCLTDLSMVRLGDCIWMVTRFLLFIPLNTHLNSVYVNKSQWFTLTARNS